MTHTEHAKVRVHFKPLAEVFSILQGLSGGMPYGGATRVMFSRGFC
jgi:hypothetical protein